MAAGGCCPLLAALTLLCGLAAASFRGREFVVVFPQNDDAKTSAKLQLQVTAQADTTVTVTGRGIAMATTLELTRGQVTLLAVPSEAELAGQHLVEKALVVEATKEVSLVIINAKYRTAEAASILPLHVWGRRYFAVTPPGTSNYGLKELVVVAGKTLANVAIKTTGRIIYQRKTYKPGSTLTVLLPPYHSLQLQSTSDLSGTEVTSDTPVGVFSGHTCVKVHGGCDQAVEQLLPVAAWGKTYVVPPTPDQSRWDMAYVVAARKTSVTFICGQEVDTKTMEAGEVQKIEVTRRRPLYLSATDPVQVVFFFTSASMSLVQDPFLLAVPPVSAYCTSYRVSGLVGYENHLVLVAPSAEAGAITVNGKTKRGLVWQEVAGTDFSWAGITMSNPEEIQSIEHPDTPFGLLVFGFQNYVGYGYDGLCATDFSLPPEEKCEMVDDQPTCGEKTAATCRAAGNGHHQTFDGRTLDFTGACTYTLTKSCHTDPALPVFSVQATNEQRGNLQGVRSVTIRIYDITVEAVRDEKGVVRVNHHRSHLPLALAQGKLLLQQRGRSLLVQAAFGLKVLYDWDHHVLVKLPATLAGQVCGVCGNANGDADDDLTPDQNWELTNKTGNCWVAEDRRRCQRDAEKKYQGATWCGLITQREGPFGACHGSVDPGVHLENCVQDLCVSEEHRATLCRALEAYADDCREEGVAVADWRTTADCALFCPKNSDYTACGTSCPTTCNAPALPSPCNTSTCLETCQCHEGFALEANQCVPAHQCGCLFQGLLHGLGETFWGDDACTQRCVCDPDLGQAVCRRAGCRHGEECRVEDGVRGCHPKSYGTCSAMGTTHYETFDGGKFIFQGTCGYQLAGLCKDNRELVDFQVLAQNGRHHDNLLASIVQVTVKVYSKTIVISQEHPSKITVDDQLANLPYHDQGGKISVQRGGQEAVLETDFGLTVTYDWQSQVTVVVPSTYSSALCGLCGNFNGRASDEMMMRNGRVTSDPDALGHSWRVTNIPGCVELSKVECPLTAAARQRQNFFKTHCGVLVHPEGPFAACHRLVDPARYFQSCMHDSCLVPDRNDIICPIISRYAAACQAAGATIRRWRSAHFCSLSCPANSHPELCSWGCSRTCGAVGHALAGCSARCREGCVCNRGFLLSGDRCVPADQCGCVHQGFYYEAEETFSSPTEGQCRCQAGGTISCDRPPCPANSEGRVVDGVYQCMPVAPGLCVATGDRSYRSFDGVAFSISGTCSYILTETCSDEVQPFMVKIRKEARKKGKVSSIQELSIKVYGLTLTLPRDKRGDVLVDSVSHHLPALLSDGRVQVLRHGLGVLLQTDFGLVVRYDLTHHVTVTVPPSHRGHLCGLCGNYNGDQSDEFLLPNGQRAPTTVDFGSAWKTPDVSCRDECPVEECPVCEENRRTVFQKRNYCGILRDPKGPFRSCHDIVDPALYFQACLHDVCLARGDSQVLCQSVQSYATACQEAGVVIKAWRKPSFCHLRCPANSVYSLCTNACTRSCASLGDAFKCPQRCVEGCQCDEGLLFDGRGCVPEDECGCFADGRYYKPHESVLKDECHRRCTCDPEQGLTCSSHSCTEDETCNIRDGVMGCINQNPCKALQCRPKERCKVKEAKCVPSLVATCWAWGDPHYHTFDGLDFDFQGTCTYTLAEFCGNDTRLVPFKVEGKNDIRGGVKTVSYVALANVKVYGHHISIHRKEVGKVRHNGVLTLLPLTLEDGKLQVVQSGLSAVLTTDFGLRVTYDWNWHLLIDLPSSYYKSTCGLCGNFNLHPEDDVPSGGKNPAAVVAWAKGWKVPDGDDDDPFCWDHCEGDCPVCEEEKRELYGGNHYCGLLKKTFQGPFQACHAVVDPRDFYRNCLYDVCLSNGAKQILCQVLDTYASTCRKHGAVVQDWRTPAGCPLSCPENSHYEACGNACPATCADRDAPATCTQPCVETCACNHGHVLSGDRCVPVGDCGCTHDGRYYRPGEEFWADETCGSRCRCDPALGMVVCQDAGCKAGERCAVVKGVRRCVATDRSICVATGDPHYTTFDGRRFDFMGTCVYQLAALCSKDPGLVPFAVTVENNNRGNHAVSYTKEVTLKVYNTTLSLSQEHPHKLKVNGILRDLPFKDGDKLQAYLKGIHGFIKTNFDVIVTFDWYSYARVILPNTYSQAVCGLCGNANGNPEDDLVLPDGRPAADETQFGDAWKVAEVPGCWAGCTEGCKVCSEAEKRAYKGDKHCGLIVKKQGPLAACHSVVDPEPYFRDCLFDVCVYEGHQDVVCSSISAYVSTCQSQGVRLKPWRTATFCSPVCPPNQHYELCGPSCAATCRGQEEPEDCDDDNALCAEGCFCDSGFLRSGRSCVPLSHCGCWHDGAYYEEGQEFVPCPNCSRRCVCQGAGKVECRPAGCEASEVCEVRDGVRGCHPRSCGRCQVMGAGSLATFDGSSLSFGGGSLSSASSCGFTLAAAEEASGGTEEPLVPFTVEVEKKGSVIRQLVVTIYGVTVGLERGTQWEVTVDGERHLLPLALAEGALTLSQEGTHRVLLAQGGFKLLFDGDTYILVTLPGTYRGRTHGLCGNFNGDADDDVKAGATLAPSCIHDPLPPTCSDAPEGPCQLLADPLGPFGGCHGVVEPQEHVTSCARQRCGRPNDANAVVCQSFQGYAAACQAAGGQLQEWREATNCPMSCPHNSHYELCTHSCAQSCAGLAASPRCTPRCFEGCRCRDGFFFNGAECVPAEQCGCLHRGRYFEIAETVLTHDCSQSCTCRGAGGLQCRAAGCPFGQSCGLADGTRSCVDQPGRCTLAPASRFISFDGIAAAGPSMATGIYVVAFLCNTQQPAWFRLLAQVGEDQDRPVVVALHLYSPGAFVTVRRDKKVWVNGVPATLPVKVSDVLTITETGGSIWLTQDPQLVAGLSGAGEVTVTVASALSGTLCGFCGDYNGDAANDLRGPDGTLVATVVAAAKVWRSPDFLD